jgi:hypothetical protein
MNLADEIVAKETNMSSLLGNRVWWKLMNVLPDVGRSAATGVEQEN